jgi:predicted nucleic acid-binding Zn ribbon protein
MSAVPSINCKVCGKSCEKIFSSSGNFVLKGSDWPSQNFRMKDDMTKKNTKLKHVMSEREKSGEGVTKMKDLTN